MDMSFFLNNSFIIFLFGAFVIGGVLISVISSGVKKGAEVAGKGIVGLLQGLFYVLRAIILFIWKIVEICFLTLSLMLAWLFSPK